MQIDTLAQAIIDTLKKATDLRLKASCVGALGMCADAVAAVQIEKAAGKERTAENDKERENSQ